MKASKVRRMINSRRRQDESTKVAARRLAADKAEDGENAAAKKQIEFMAGVASRWLANKRKPALKTK